MGLEFSDHYGTASITENGIEIARYNTATHKTKVINEGQKDDITAKLKQAYGVGIVKTQAKKYGWELKQTGPAKFEVLKQRR